MMAFTGLNKFVADHLKIISKGVALLRVIKFLYECDPNPKISISLLVFNC